MLAKVFIIGLTILSLNHIYVLAIEQKHLDKLPSNIPNCQEVKTTIEDCIGDAFNIMLRESKAGIPELNIPAIDPLLQEKLKVEFSNDLLRGKAIARNVKIYGFSECTVYGIEYHRKATDLKFNFHMKCPKIDMHSIYRAEIKINNVKFSAKGDFNVTMTDIDAYAQHAAEFYERDNETFVRVTKANIHPQLGNLHINATGLVPEPALNDAFLEILNQNWRAVADSALPAIHGTAEPIILQYANEILGLVPFKLIFKE